MLIYSMSVSVDGFIADRAGAFLVETKTFSSRVIYERYVRALDQSD